MATEGIPSTSSQVSASGDRPLPIGIYREDTSLIGATLADGTPRLRIYPYPGTAVILGRGSQPERELWVEACREDGIEVLRRQGGGCAVVLDPGNVVLSLAIVTPEIGSIRRQLDTISDWLIEGLQQIGVTGVVRQGSSDLAWTDRKISGSCMARSRGLLYYSATLLVDPRVDLMERYLRHPPREPEYRRHRSHRDFVGSLLGMPGCTSKDELCRSLRDHLDVRTLALRLGY